MSDKPKSEPPPPRAKTASIAYRVELVSLSDAATIAAFLNQIGAEGWDLVATRQIGFARDLYIFKQ